MHGTLGLGIIIALAVGGCAQVEQRQHTAEPVGIPLRVGISLRTPVGDAIATIIKDRDPPNAFGRADVYGRRIDAGFTRLIHRGRGLDGSALVEQVDVDVRSNASTLTRRPVLDSRTQPAVASSRERRMAYGTSRIANVASPADQISMSLPEAAQFLRSQAKNADIADRTKRRVSVG